MPAKPSMKGSLISELAADVRKLIADGKISKAEMERRLTPEDLATLDSEIMVSGWYDVQFYARCSRMVRDILGRGSNEYLFKRGADRGKQLIDAGLYQQMDYANRAKVQLEQGVSTEDRFKNFGRDLKLLVTLSRSLLNFTQWSTIVDPAHSDRYLIVVEGAEGYPDELAWATEGLIDSISAIHGMGNRMWRHRRVGKDRIEFQMTRAI